MLEDNYTQNWQEARTKAEKAGLRIVEHGWEQHVIIDESQGLIYRYPRHAAAAAKLADEVAVLHSVHQQEWPIKLPVMQDHNAVFTMYDYIPGEVILHDEDSNLSDKDCQKIGKKLGVFLAQFHQLDPAIIDKKETKQITTLLEYYAARIESGVNTPFYQQAQTDIQNLISSSRDQPNVVVHGDLHGPNIVINPDTKELVGVIDLSEMEVGDPHQEFRKLFMTDQRLLEPSLVSYQANGGQEIDRGLVKLWAYVNEWANVCHFANETDNITYQRAKRHLTKWGLLS